MTYDAQTYSTAELARLVKDVGAGLKAVSQKIDQLDGKFVTRAEFEAWQTAYDREARDLKVSLEAARAASAPVKTSGWQVAAVVISSLVGAGSLLTLIINLV